jgi:hypothetical protein
MENPEGLSANRWVIGEWEINEQVRIIETDVFRGRSFDLLKFAVQNPAILAAPQLVATGENSSYVLVEQDRPKSQNFFTIHLPEGTRQTVSGTAYLVAGPDVVNLRNDGVDIYGAKTGNLVSH